MRLNYIVDTFMGSGTTALAMDRIAAEADRLLEVEEDEAEND